MENINGKPVIYNCGYQFDTIASFVEKLKSNGITMLVDVREKPYSRKREFSRGPLSSALKRAGIGYKWMGTTLGGMTCSRELWMMGCKILAGMVEDEKETIAMMCMETDYNRCHRAKLAEILATEFKINNINI